MAGEIPFEEAVEAVAGLLGTAIRPSIYRLADGELVGALTVDPDVAFAALRLWDPN